MRSRTILTAALALATVAAAFGGCAHVARTGDPLAASVFSEMVRLSSGTSARISSFDRSGGNIDARAIAPGDTLELADIPDAGCIRHIYFTVIGPDPAKVDYLQDLVLRMYWDGEIEPSVETPFGDFFGQGHGRITFFRSLMVTVNEGAEMAGAETTLTVGFNTYFPMPFENGARLTLTNEGDQPVGACWYHIDYETLERVPKHVGRFHAQYRQEKPTRPVGALANMNVCSGEGLNIDGAENYVILEAEGQGNFAGYFLNVENFAHTWYGEGDDMIFIDGAAWPPSFHGTGSEEIFGGGACPNIAYAGPYTGFHHTANKDYFGTISMYRFYVNDPIRFRQSIRATIEHGHNNNFSNDYSSVAFWYQAEPHAPFEKLPPVEERRRRKGDDPHVLACAELAKLQATLRQYHGLVAAKKIEPPVELTQQVFDALIPEIKDAFLAKEYPAMIEKCGICNDALRTFIAAHE